MQATQGEEVEVDVPEGLKASSASGISCYRVYKGLPRGYIGFN